MRFAFVIFIAIASLIIMGGHALIYFSWVRFFNIGDPAFLRTLRISLALLSVSFLGASFLVHRYDNHLTGALYYLASIWLGLLLNLFLATLAMWLIVLIKRTTGVAIDFRLIGSIMLSMTIIYSAYGIWNAAYPKVRQIEVSIKNMPSSWQGRKAVQLSDIHLGVINGQRFMERIVEKVNEVSPDIIFITGDLFDGIGDDLAKLSAELNKLHPPLGIYFVTGNHETYLGLNRALEALSQTDVKVLRNQVVEIDGIQLMGIDYHGTIEEKKQVLSQLDNNKPNIVLYHSPVFVNLFKEAGVNLQLAGHTHRGQLWPLNYITSRVYNGFDYGLHRDGNYILYTSSGAGTWGPPMRTGTSPEIVVIKFN